MKARVLTGSKQEIAEKVTAMDGEVREAIVFVEEATASVESAAEIFAEMEPYTVRQPAIDDSREPIYRRMEGE